MIAEHVEPTGRILDVGCGTGDLVWRLAEKADEVVGIELSPAMVDFARARLAERSLPHVSFVLGDVTGALAHRPEGHFDLATMVLALHEMPEGVRAAVLREVTRLARRLVCVDFRAAMPRNVAGLRNRLFEILGGMEHYRAFRSFQRLGGMARIWLRRGRVLASGEERRAPRRAAGPERLSTPSRDVRSGPK